jgi:hypothetical protein
MKDPEKKKAVCSFLERTLVRLINVKGIHTLNKGFYERFHLSSKTKQFAKMTKVMKALDAVEFKTDILTPEPEVLRQLRDVFESDLHIHLIACLTRTSQDDVFVKFPDMIKAFLKKHGHTPTDPNDEANCHHGSLPHTIEVWKSCVERLKEGRTGKMILLSGDAYSFKNGSEIGRGGQGKVVEAMHLQTGQRQALKKYKAKKQYDKTYWIFASQDSHANASEQIMFSAEKEA